MKKFFALALALVMICALSVTCFAAIGRDGTGSETATVKANYTAGALSADVYGVDVKFGDMTFTYTAQGQGTWDPADHTYKNLPDATWVGNTNTSGDVTVTNHSNVDINVTVAYADNTNDDDTIAGKFDEGAATITFALDKGVLNKYDEADSKTVKLTLSGDITADNNNLGTVTVTIAKKNAVQ